MHVETQDVAEQVVDVLSGVKGIAAAAAVAERGVEIAVGSETEPARLVVARAGCGMVMIGVALAASATFGFADT